MGQAVGGGAVVQAPVEGDVIFDTALYRYAFDAELSNESIDVPCSDFFDQNIRGEITAPHDHEPRQFGDGFLLTHAPVERGLGIVLFEQGEWAPIGDAGERIEDGKRIVQ